MILLRDIRYVRLGTRDLDASARFARDVLGLEPARADCNARYFRSDNRDHTLVYFKGDPLDHATAFELEGREALHAAGEVLESLKRNVKWGTKNGCEQRRVESYISFKDPSGNQIELVVRPHHSGKEYVPQRAAGITGFSHIGLRTIDPVSDEAFWTQVMNARVSDRIGSAPLLRIDDIMRSWYFLKEQGVKIVFGPGRHPTSGAMFLYFEGPERMVYEYSGGVRPSSFCMRSSRPDIPEFRDQEESGAKAA